ncbi:hypothetical protein RN001_013638 [Aquatica leii]|uniref:Centrosomal protein of 131 kDa n=1 Tax=Aquatica leii TaxID=1421715 RepID=A0AAN7QDC7_9COLE|nr:hypothetical protein RN001_013638 [Aquatica leii]
MKGDDTSNLKLTGNQIKLSTRPVSSTGSASSRCALLGRNLQRPMSAIPLLNLGCNEFEMLKNLSTKRPWSADNPISRKSSYFDTINTDGTTSVDSTEEMDTVLPSSNLLEELLSEPLYTWKNGKRTKTVRKNKVKRPVMKVMRRSLTQIDNDTPSAGSDTNSSIESIPTKTQMLNVEPLIQPPLPIIENEYDESIKAMALVPGLKTKPPIPKKPDLHTPKSGKKNNDSTNFEIITNSILSYGLPPTLTDADRTKNDILVDIANATSNSESDAPETKVQNWFQDQKVSDDVKVSELNTDMVIENLKSHQTVNDLTISESESDAQSASSKSKNCLGEISNYNPKRVNFEELNQLEIKTKYEKRKASKNFIKENIQLNSIKSRKKFSDLQSDEHLLGTTKFTPTPMKSFPDFKESQFTDVESWMSTKTQENENDNFKTSFLDCLNKVQELQETCKELDEISEGDVTECASVEQSDNNTYDDIVSILQTLEEEDKKSHNQMKSMKKIINEELLSTESDTSKEQKPKYDQHIDNRKSKISENDQDNINRFILESKNNQQQEAVRTSLNPSSNLNDIFLFLDEVDKNCSQSLACAKDRVNSVTQVLETSLQLDTVPKLEELLEHSNFELSNYVISLNLRLKEKASAILLLQKELSSLREQITKINKNTSVIIKERLKSQKNDYENAVKRHQKFIDQLIADKKTLNQQCESLVNEMKMLEDRYSSNLKAAEHRHHVELQKIKDMQVAGEKMRKERWIDTKTQKIKELTIKGIEPELEKMSSRHQQELADLRTLHKREIEDLDLRSARKLQQHCEALREQLTVENEKALAHERDLLRQRYERMVETEEQNFQDQRRKLLAEHSKKVSECEERKNEALIEKDRCIKQAKMDFEDKLQVTIRKHNIELNLLKEKTELEMETFRNNYKKQLVLQLGEKEALIREKCRQDRDKEIETVIERLEQEASETKLQMEQSFENRIRRLKEKYEKEIKDLEESERNYNRKYTENKIKLAETEDLIAVLKTTVNQLDGQLLETKAITDRLTKEKENLREILKNEMKQEISHLKTEINDQKNEKEKELQKVYARVKVAVARKDETILELNRDLLALQEKCAYLENMMEQQRKEYLIK